MVDKQANNSEFVNGREVCDNKLYYDDNILFDH